MNRFAHAILSLLYPEGCSLCAQPIDPTGRSGICRGCWRRIDGEDLDRCDRCGTFLPGTDARRCLACRLRPVSFDGARSFAPFEGETAEVLRLLKYAGRPGLAAPLADRLLADRASADFLSGCDALVPVPLHRARRRRRGYDQAEVIARVLSRRLHLPVLRGLRRCRRTRPQVRLGARSRERNMRGAFVLGCDPRRIRGTRVCLVDDVWTTGATLRAAGRALRKGVPSSVYAFTVARA